MNTQKVDNLINLTFKLLTKKVEFLKYKLSSNVNKNNNIYIFAPNFCTYCGSIKFSKQNKGNNKQGYKCYDCKKTFTSIGSSTFNYLHQSHYDKFKKFIDCAINSLSLKRIVEICNISVACDFNCRNEIINYLTNEQQSNKNISSLIEMNEIYFKNSFGKRSWKCEYVFSVGLSEYKVCITTIIDRNKNISIDFIEFEKSSTEKLYNNYIYKIVEMQNSRIITDDNNIYLGFTKMIGWALKMLSKRNSSNYRIRKIPIIENDNGVKYRIQNINNFHSKMKVIINNKFKGVSSKYFIQYINRV